MNETFLNFPCNDQRYDVVFPDLSHIRDLAINLGAKAYLQSFNAKYGEFRYIVDVGACTGTWTVPYALFFPKASVLAIEPSGYNFPYLVKNTQRFSNVKTLKLVASNTHAMEGIAIPTDQQLGTEGGSKNVSVYGRGNVLREEVECNLLDNVLTERVDWLKIDVEGHERFVLDGATRILREHRPVLQVEVDEHHQRMGGFSAFRLLHKICSFDYTLVGELGLDWAFVPKERV